MKVQPLTSLLLCLSFALLFLSPLLAEEPIRHSILYLYKSDFGETKEDNDGVNLWAFPLYQLGFSVVTYDTLGDKVPDEKFMEPFHGILAPAGSWETSLVWAKWLKSQMENGRKVLIMAPLGPGDPDEDEDTAPYHILNDEKLNLVYSTLGFTLDSTFAIEEGEGGVNLIRWKHKAQGWFGYDKDLVQGDTPYYLKWTPTTKDVESLLTLCWDGIDNTDSVAVGFTPRGGLAIEEYIKFADFKADVTRWRIDPVRFLGKAFRVGDLPRPECNVICGNRTLLCHFGGGGSRRKGEDDRTYGQALLEDVLAGPSRPKFPIMLTNFPKAKVSSLKTTFATTNGYEDVLATAHNVRLTGSKFSRFADPDPDFSPDESGVLIFPTASVPIEEYFEKALASPFAKYFGDHEKKLMLLPTQRPEPLNLHIPYDLAETKSSRALLLRLLQWADSLEMTPIYLDEYLQMARAGRYAEIGRTDDGGFFVEQDGKLPALRFDRNQGYPDLQRSKGIIGYRRIGDSLYVYLNEAKRQKVYLSSQRPKEFSLARANRPIRDLRREGFRWLFTTRGPMAAKLDFQGLNANDSYVAELFEVKTQKIMDELSFRTNDLGEGSLLIEYPGWARVEFWSTTDEAYWLIKAKRFFWRTGTLPLFVILAVFIFLFVLWKLAKLITG